MILKDIKRFFLHLWNKFPQYIINYINGHLKIIRDDRFSIVSDKSIYINIIYNAVKTYP